jgi:hypothetical protein
MSADLSIHVLEGATEGDLARFFSNTMGSKYFNAFDEGTTRQSNDEYMSSLEIVADTPSVWVGEVSWLKAALFEDPDAFIPDTVNQINEIIGEDLPVIDDDLIKRISDAFNVPNNTTKPDGVWDGAGYRIAERETVVNFLEQHRGKPVFTVSW